MISMFCMTVNISILSIISVIIIIIIICSVTGYCKHILYFIKWDFDIVGTEMGEDFVVRKAEGEVLMWILERLKWGEVKAAWAGGA